MPLFHEHRRMTTRFRQLAALVLGAPAHERTVPPVNSATSTHAGRSLALRGPTAHDTAVMPYELETPAPTRAEQSTQGRTGHGRLRPRSARTNSPVARLLIERLSSAPGVDGPADWDADAWLERARRLHADTPILLGHLEQSVRVAQRIAEAGRVYKRLTDHDQRVLVAAAAIHHIGAATGAQVTGVPAIDGGMYLAQRGAVRLAALYVHHMGGAEEADGWGGGALIGALPLDPLHDMLLLVDLHVDDRGRIANPIHELERRIQSPETPDYAAQYLRTNFQDIIMAAAELERWGGRFS